MELLRVEHEDLQISVEASNFATIFERARRRQSSFEESTSFQISSGRLFLRDVSLAELRPARGLSSHPLFFENKDYFIGITFVDKQAVTSAHVSSRTKEVQDKFFYKHKIGYLAGTLNFGNDIGRHELVVRYDKNRQVKEFRVAFEVFPTKLDYRHDHRRMIEDIEKLYPYLVLDFLKKTYSGFGVGDAPNTDLIWWQVFGGLYAEFIRASNFILNRPHSRIVRHQRKVKAEKIKRWSVALEERVSERRHLPQSLYATEHKILSVDTPENRFFKHALLKTSWRYSRLRSYIETTFQNAITNDFRQEMLSIERQLTSQARNPFLKPIGPFRGMRQESLLLQKGTGYSSIYRCWLALNSGIRFLEGVQRIELKNVADLYQIWCFLQVKGTVERLLGVQPKAVDLAEIRIDDFVFKIARGTTSRITFEMANGELVELYHDLAYRSSTIPDTRLTSFTVDQRPDIVLRITKNDLRDAYAMTYLFDAKYRLQSDDNENAPDLPTEDSINQMHRYRDAIYYLDQSKDRPQKEVLGAYVLFPGRGSETEVAASSYMRSIDKVNIGAFPLVPGKNSTRAFLEQHLNRILGLPTEAVLNTVTPHKQSAYESPNPEVLIGIVPDLEHARCFKEGERRLYYTGKKKPTHFGNKSLRYFAPWLQGRGVEEFYEILHYELLPRNQIFPPNHPLSKKDDDSERLVLFLGERFEIISSGPFLKLSDGVIYHFRYTNLFNLRNPRNGKIDVFVVTK